MHEIATKTVPFVDINKVRCIKGHSEIVKNYNPYLSDESRLAHKGSKHLFFPKDESELSSVFREMSKRGINIALSSARTGLVGGAVPYGGAIVSLERFNKFLDLRFDNHLKEWLVRTQCAVIIRDLNDSAMKKNFPGLSKNGSPETRAFLEKYRESKGTYFYPPDPTEMGAFIGATVATNASGARTYRYGATRNWVRLLRVMLASGEVLEIPRGKYFASPDGEFVIIDSKGNETTVKIPIYSMPLTKNTAGIYATPNMDLIDLFIGSEGILGAITEVEVALQKWDRFISIIQFFPSDEKAIDFVIALRKEKTIKPEFIEFYSSHALNLLREKQREDPKVVGMPLIPDYANSAIFFDIQFYPEEKNNDFSKLKEVVSICGSNLTKSWAAYEKRDMQRFKDFRHILPETLNSIITERKKIIPELHKLGTDFAVPNEKLKEIWAFYKSTLEREGLEWLAFGHIGNNHFHVNVLPRSLEEMKTCISVYKEFAKKAVSLGGTISAEHGIGKIKKEFFSIMFSQEKINAMKAVKIALDPGLMINPGDMFDI